MVAYDIQAISAAGMVSYVDLLEVHQNSPGKDQISRVAMSTNFADLSLNTSVDMIRVQKHILAVDINCLRSLI